MKKLMLLCMAAGALTFTACREDSGTSTETNTNDSDTPDNAAGSTQMDSTSTTAANYNYDAEYRERATRLARQVTSDLQLDQATQERVRTVYYNRARQVDELERTYSSRNASAGLAFDSAVTSGSEDLIEGDMQVNGYPEERPETYYTELETINSNVDLELKGLLTPQQFKVYQSNRGKYYGDDIKYETSTGDKLKIDGDEAKVKVGDAKMKRDGDEAKFKAGDTKIKKDGNETKVKTDDGKIKMEE
ncbi:hypothetical protein GU926_08985 [Nibribacter ruber]|uniref:Lipoprotein n=1 Tax=Nibribacter ruber TaxID=2698458 RepID=A0A6P1NZH9_9BACT|nr:hypothetical protein [Nibribacter ruber]QHL87565.1 hypothetical protein GU926_08985 [Nibribacter ruber]